MSNRANKTQGKGKLYATRVDGFDHNGFARRSTSNGSFGRTKHPITQKQVDRELANIGLVRTGKKAIRTQLGNIIPLKGDSE